MVQVLEKYNHFVNFTAVFRSNHWLCFEKTYAEYPQNVSMESTFDNCSNSQNGWKKLVKAFICVNYTGLKCLGFGPKKFNFFP